MSSATDPLTEEQFWEALSDRVDFRLPPYDPALSLADFGVDSFLIFVLVVESEALAGITSGEEVAIASIRTARDLYASYVQLVRLSK